MQNNYNENTGTAFPVFSILNFNGRAYDHRLVTDYLSPSNHLLMQWQTYTSRNGDNKRKHKKYFIEMICRKYQIFKIRYGVLKSSMLEYM